MPEKTDFGPYGRVEPSQLMNIGPGQAYVQMCGRLDEVLAEARKQTALLERIAAVLERPLVAGVFSELRPARPRKVRKQRATLK